MGIWPNKNVEIEPKISADGTKISKTFAAVGVV
jgi:hypothetical protein